MALHPPPIPLLNLVESYDATVTPVVGRRMNAALVSLFPGITDDLLHAEIGEYQHIHSTCFTQWRNKNSPTPLLGNSIQLKATKEQIQDVFPMGACHVFHAKVVALEPLTIALDDRSLILSQNKSRTALWFVEQFAGSYGGWSHALDYIHQFLDEGDRPHVLAIEAHLPHAVNFALAHRYQLVGSPADLTTTFLKDHPANTIIHCPIQDLHWQRLLQDIHTLAWCISAPCPSWSFAGDQEGFFAQDGQCLADALGQAKIHRPDYLLLEQVSGFPAHDHFDMFCRLLAWAGYRVLHHQCYELSNVCPVKRCRWIALCHHVSVTPPFVPIARWPKLMTTPQHFDAILCLDDMQLRTYEPNKETAQKYWNPAYMPGKKTNWSKQDIIRFRLPSLEEPLPTFLAAYGSQHGLPEKTLLKRGMFGHFVRQNNTFRFFCPVEILMLHSHATTTLILKPIKHAYQSLGNCITIPHALFGFFHLFKALDQLPSDLTFTALLVRFLSERLRASKVVVIQDNCAWYVGHPQECQELKLLLQFYMAQMQWKVGDGDRQWPPNAFFHPVKGLIPIEVTPTVIEHTQPFRVSFQVMPGLIPGEYGLLLVDGRTTWDTLLQLWHHPVTPQDFMLDVHRRDSPMETTSPDAKVLLLPSPDSPSLDVRRDHHYGLLLRTPEDLTLYEVHQGETWSDVCNRCLLPDRLYYDQMGAKQANDPVLPFLEVQTDVPDQLQLEHFGSLFEAIRTCTWTTWVPENTDILVMMVQGPPQACQAFAAVWMHPQLSDWLLTKGRQITMQHETEGKWRMVFRPVATHPTIPVPHLRHSLFFKMLRMATDSLMMPSGLQWQLKYQGKPCCHGNASLGETILILDLLRYFGQLLVDQVPVIYEHNQALPTAPSITTEGRDFELRLVASDDQGLSNMEHDTNEHPDPWFDPLDLVANLAWDVVLSPDATSLHVQYRGDSMALSQIAHLWQRMHIADLCHQEGFRLQCGPVSDLEPTTIRFHVQPLHESQSVHKMQFIIFRQLLLGFLQASTQQPGLSVTFTYRHQTLVQVDVHPDTSKRAVDVIVKHVYKILNQQAPRVLLGGLIQDASFSLGDYAMEHEVKQIIINVADPVALRLTGGGGSKPPTNKQDFAKMVESNVANMLLDYDLHLPQIPAAVTKLLDKHGMSQVHQTLNTASNGKKHELFRDLCRQADVKLPSGGPRRSLTQGSYTKLQERKQLKAALAVDPGHYQLKVGFFRNSDGTAATLLTQFSPHANGILMTNTQTAQEWANVFTTLATDELALYVLGPPPKCSLPMSTVGAPAIHQETGKEVLLNGVLIQFGSKHILTSAASLDQVQVKDTQVASITVWKADIDQTLWQKIQSAPVKTVLDMIERDAGSGILQKAWGRVWQKDGVNVPPAQATSLQFHGEFERSARFSALLKRSGFSSVFIQPKGPQGRPAEQWRVIWLQGTALEIETKTAAVSGTAGLVRSRKGLGIRVESGAFSPAWKLLKPDLEEPDVSTPALVCRLYPLPHGVDATILKQWAASQFNWPIKPLKSLGAKQWVIACDHIPEGFLTFNGQPLLLQQLPQKGTASSGLVLAGPRSSISDLTRQSTSASSTTSPDPLQDPWAPAAAARREAATRTVEGPVAGLFQQQDSRIQTLEQAVQKLQTSHQETSKAIQERQQTIEGHLHAHVQQTQLNFERVQTDQHAMQQTIAQAMHQQEERLVSAFDELKVLFTRGIKRQPDAVDANPAQEMLDFNE
eukprot:Skav212509  [mRNA]  locus=scaffold2713:134609:139813:+ [translate_table: standard]